MTRLALTILALVPFSAQANTACPRTVSIGGALTEIIYQLEQHGCLVGADTTSTYPQATATLPLVGYQRQLSAEGILSLKPEVVVHTQHAGPPAVLHQLDQAGIRRVVINDEPSLEGVYGKVRAIAELYEVSANGEQLITAMQRAAATLTMNDNQPRVLFMMQHGGGAPMAGGQGTAADAIITLAGGNNVVSFERYKPLTPEALVSLNPDIIVTTEDSLKQMGGLDGFLQTPGIALTRAARQQRIVAMDALLILGFGPRTVDAAHSLAAAFQQAH